MKKILTLAAAMLVALAASAQEAVSADSVVNITPDPADSLTTKAFDVVFTFSGEVTYDSVYIVSGTTVKKYKAPTTEASTTVTVPVTESDWSSDVVAGNYMLDVKLTGVVNSKGDSVDYSSGLPGVVMVSYRYAATTTPTAQYVGADEDPYWMLAQDLVDFPITFMFTDEVTMSDANATAVVRYYGADDGEIFFEDIPASDIEAGWIPRTNYYGLSLLIPDMGEYWEYIAYVTISLQGIKSNGAAVALETPLITFYTSFEDEFALSKAPKQNDATGINNIGGSQQKTADVYSAAGTLVKKNASPSDVKSLAKGLYIVNGKKVLVK